MTSIMLIIISSYSFVVNNRESYDINAISSLSQGIKPVFIRQRTSSVHLMKFEASWLNSINIDKNVPIITYAIEINGQRQHT